MIWTDQQGGAYVGPGYSGYTNDTNQVGKYTRALARAPHGSIEN